MHFCKNESRVPLVTSLMQSERVHSFLREKEIDQSGIWVPFHDEQDEGDWRDFFNHQVLNFTPPWGKNEPNGGIKENCIFARISAWWDAPCAWPGPFCLCQRNPSFNMRLRGLCAKSAVDKYYQPMNDYSDFTRLQLVGLLNSEIEYDGKSKNWKLSLAEANVSGISNASHNTFLLGKHSWTIIGDSGCKSNGEEYTSHLKLTGCNVTGHFTCDDAQCVPMEQRCKPFLINEYQTDVQRCRFETQGKLIPVQRAGASTDHGQ